jgi:hypothetical protein
MPRLTHPVHVRLQYGTHRFGVSALKVRNFIHFGIEAQGSKESIYTTNVVQSECPQGQDR